MKRQKDIDFADLSRDENPHPGLIVFYKGARIYFWLETITALAWITQMFIFKFAETASTSYRATNVALLFHFSTVMGMVNVVQQTVNNNSVQWWLSVFFLVGLFGDLDVFLEIVVKKVPQDTLWAWVVLLIHSVYSLSLSFFALGWFVYWFYWRRPLDIPLPAAYVEKLRNDVESGGRTKYIVHTQHPIKNAERFFPSLRNK